MLIFMFSILSMFLAEPSLTLDLTPTVTNPLIEWIHIGTRKVDKKKESDIIPIKTENGNYRFLKFQLEDGSLNFTQLIITFRDKSKQIVNLRKTIKSGDSSQPIGIDLKGRHILNVEYKYDTKGVRVKKAKVKLYGEF